MNLDLLFKILLAILIWVILVKSIKFITGLVFRLALMGLCFLFLYNLLMIVQF